jgi:CheY-like chemotaxis protein
VAERYLDSLWIEHGYGTRFQGFQNLMRRRIRDVLLVSSTYDLYLFEEDGRFYELIENEYHALDLSHAPALTRVSSGKEAIALVKEERRFDLIITTLHIQDMTPTTLVNLLRQAGNQIPVVLLLYDSRELKDLETNYDRSVFDRVFVWQRNFRLIVAIIKHLEDRINADHDTRLVGVQSIIVIEDNALFYSHLLPIIYTELFLQSKRLLSEGINLSHKYLRTVARPKVLLCQTYEQAWRYYTSYRDTVLGVISDIEFPCNGVLNPTAGLSFAEAVRSERPDLPILLQSLTPDYGADAQRLNVSFTLKDSPNLLLELRQFMTEYFSFGDFIFRTPDGREVARASDLKTLREALGYVPEESIRYHAERNHFSNWLKGRTEFLLAHKLRPRTLSDFASLADLRENLIDSLGLYTQFQHRGLITEFEKESFNPKTGFARIGGGMLGGKARGLGFISALMNNYSVMDRYENVRIAVPPAVVVATDVFDQFVDQNRLRDFALETADDVAITKRFLEAGGFPEKALAGLAAFLQLVCGPLAVRSSSLLEDSQYHPFAGVYQTYMIPNNHPDFFVRLGQLVTAIKRVYASTFYQTAKNYIQATPYRPEDERMAVIVQQMIGAQHGNRFYPDVAGVAKSYNFYAVAPQKPLDGIVSAALGLGKMVAEGGMAVRFCPKYPNHLIQFSAAADALKNSQRAFYALDMSATPTEHADTSDTLVKRFDLTAAEEDRTLQFVASTYSPENDALYDGMSRRGVRVVSFAPILRNRVFPLPNALELLLEMGTWGMGTPVEIEFAATLSVPRGVDRDLALLQMRPLVLSRESGRLEIEASDRGKLLCISHKVLGHGILDDIRDIVVVDPDRFDRARSREVAWEVMQFNARLVSEHRRYLLIGVGRWGTLDPWLGIPVKWDQISGARAIVEAGFKDLEVDPSQGSHFFQNITSFRVQYFSISPSADGDFVDWEWMRAQPALEDTGFVRHLQLTTPVVVKVDGHQNKGIILKPE